MQKGFIKNILFLLLFAFVFVLNNYIYMSTVDTYIVNSNLNSNHNLYSRIAGTCVTDNYFFTKAKRIIDDLGAKFESQGVGKEAFYLKLSKLKDLRSIIKKITSYNFKLKSMTYSTLISAFTQIDNNVKILFDNSMDLSQKDIDEAVLAFDLLREGIYYELSLEHLLELKKFIIKNLDEIISLIDYWKFKLVNKGIQGHIEGIFQKKDDKIKSKIRNLFFLKNRIATFLGKIEELVGGYFLILDSKKDRSLDFDKLKRFVKESIFCVNSFFMHGFNPGVGDYDLGLDVFAQNFVNQSFRKFLANHMNVLLLEEGSRYLLNDYRTPGFLKRNWLKLSVFAVTGTITGVYIYNNWDEISTRSIEKTNDTIDSLKKSYSDFLGMLKTKFGLDISGVNAEEEDNVDPKKISNMVKEKLSRLKADGGGDLAFDEDWDALLKILKTKLDIFLGILGIKELPEGIDIGELPDEESFKLGWWADFFANRGLGAEKKKVVQDVLTKIFFIKTRWDSAKNKEIDKELVVALYNVIFSSAEKADGLMNQLGGMANDLSVTANWVKVTVPVILTSVVIPLTSIFLIRKKLKNKKLRRQAQVNNTIIDIYRILNVNNKASVDIKIRDLSYEDQGLLAFFVNRLNLNVSRFFKSENSRLINLVNDLKNSNFTVAQKLDFIKAGWGYNLFEESLTGAN